MYNLFEQPKYLNRSIRLFPKFKYISDKMEYDINRVIKFSRSFPKFLNSNNFLVTILESITVGFNAPLSKHADVVDDAAMRLSMSLGMTSSLYKGRVFVKGKFMEPGTNEILVATDEPFDTSDLMNTWKDLRPVTYIHHESPDVTFPLLHGRGSKYAEGVPDIGFTVIKINIPMLSTQYQCWRRATANQQSGEHQSINQFVMSYPIANSIWSFTNYALFNRFKGQLYGEWFKPSANYHSFAITNISKRLSDCNAEILEYLQNTKLDFATILKSIPALEGQTMLEVLTLGNVPPSRQLEWAMHIARLPATAFYLTIREATEASMDNNLNQMMRAALRDMKSDSVLRAVLNPDQALTVNRYIKNFISPFI